MAFFYSIVLVFGERFFSITEEGVEKHPTYSPGKKSEDYSQNSRKTALSLDQHSEIKIKSDKRKENIFLLRENMGIHI